MRLSSTFLRFRPAQPEIARADTAVPLIKASGLGVKYTLGSRRDDAQSRAFNALFRRRSKKEFWALKDVHLEGCSGDILGVIGSNGAGKTTLCKLISGLLRPDAGEIRVEGDVSALFSLGTGFNNRLTGRENVFLNGMMLGLSKGIIRHLLPQIVEFSGLGGFIDQPLKTYSSGMRARLGFAIAAMIEPEILVLDEALGSGDLGFSERAAAKMQEIIGRSKIVVVVTHDLDFVEKYCTRALWLDKGRCQASGLPREVVSFYRDSLPKGAKKKRIVDLAVTPRRSGAPRVIVSNLGVRFSLHERRKANGPENEGFLDGWGNRRRPFWALMDVNLTVSQGDIVGVIGANGAGKTTLCRVLSGILSADRGEVFVSGEITALLTFGAGFKDQLNGRDNIYLNGMMLGIPRRKLADLYDDIVEFSGLASFMDEPVKHYSRGMRSRLGFSVAAMIEPDILIVDEALKAGDLAFYEKASTKIQELIDHAKVVIVVTHNLAFVEKVCTRALWLDCGVVRFDGDPGEAVARYRESVKKVSAKKPLFIRPLI